MLALSLNSGQEPTWKRRRTFPCSFKVEGGFIAEEAHPGNSFSCIASVNGTGYSPQSEPCIVRPGPFSLHQKALRKLGSGSHEATRVPFPRPTWGEATSFWLRKE